LIILFLNICHASPVDSNSSAILKSVFLNLNLKLSKSAPDSSQHTVLYTHQIQLPWPSLLHATAINYGHLYHLSLTITWRKGSQTLSDSL